MTLTLKKGDRVWILPSCPDWLNAPRGTYIVSDDGLYHDKVVVKRKDESGYVQDWFVHIKYISKRPPIDPTTIKPYPHTCKMCKSPSRKCGTITLCSNMKCKSKKMVKALSSRLIETMSRNNNQFVICPKCDEVATLAYYGPAVLTFVMTCKSNHKWEYKASIGHKICNNNGVVFVCTLDGNAANVHSYKWLSQ